MILVPLPRRVGPTAAPPFSPRRRSCGRHFVRVHLELAPDVGRLLRLRGDTIRHGRRMHPALESLESQVSVIFAVPDSRGMLCRCGSWSASSAEVDSVSKRHRSFLLASLLPAFLVVSAFAVLQAREGKSTAAKPARWSDPATWPDRQVPRAGDKVTIAAGKDVVLDVSPPALNGLTIDGKLSFAILVNDTPTT